MMTMTTPTVLFVCVHNAGRSQMAAGLLAHHAQGRVGARSAGRDNWPASSRRQLTGQRTSS
jgi:arsenate reductase